MLIEGDLHDDTEHGLVIMVIAVSKLFFKMFRNMYFFEVKDFLFVLSLIGPVYMEVGEPRSVK